MDGRMKMKNEDIMVRYEIFEEMDDDLMMRTMNEEWS